MLEWWQILLIVVGGILLLFLLSILLYRQFFKRFWDMVLSGFAILILSPFLIVLTVVGAIAMRGNPFFTQERPGKKEKVFKLIKFRSMNNKKDENGKMLPDNQRLTRYGSFLRSTSLDELPELFNIFLGNMSIVGPRPLLVEYLPWYTKEERHRHDIRPGLTGWAQINGRNDLNWDLRFKFDVYYVYHYSLFFDLRICIVTVFKIFKKDNIQIDTEIEEGNMAEIRRKNNGGE